MPHAHAHPPNLPPPPAIPLPSTGPIIPIPILSGATRTLINGMPAGRCGDLGLGIWCGGYFPMYEVFLGSSSVWIEGARAGRLAVDITKHCILSKPGGDAPIGAFLGMTMTASTNVLIGGVPMPSLLALAMGALMKALMKGLGKVIVGFSRRFQKVLPAGSRLRRAFCAITGHPVDVSSGRVFTDHRDFLLVGQVPIDMCRTYDSSAAAYAGPLGPGWIHPFDIHLWVDRRQDMVVLRDRENHLVGFGRVETGAETFNPIEQRWLARPAENEYVIRDMDGFSWRFAPVGGAVADEPVGYSEQRALRLIDVEDRNGNWAGCQYHSGLLVRIVDSAERTLVLHYAEIEGSPRLTSIRLLDRRTASDGARLVSYEYTEDGHLATAFDGEGHATRYEYAADLLVKETNRNGLSFYFEYEGAGSNARCVRTWGDGNIYARTLMYDTVARRARVIDSVGATTEYQFDASGRTLQIRDPLGGVVRFEYDNLGNLVTEIDEENGRTEYEYDELGNRTRMTWPDGATTLTRYDQRGLALETTDAAGAVWKFEYDEQGNLIARIDASGHRWSYEFDHRGRWVTARDPEGRVTQYEHDRRGLATRVRRGSWWFEVKYDDFGNVIEARKAVGAPSYFRHDRNGRLVETESDGRHSRSRYDGEGNLIEQEDADGRVTRWSYEGMNKASSEVDPSGLIRRLRHDTEGRLIELQNEVGESFRFEYDLNGNLVRQVGFAGEEWQFLHNRTGGVVSTIDPMGRTITYERDPRNRLLRKRLPDGLEKAFAYDPVGRLVRAVGESTLMWAYDAVGRLVSEEQEDGVTRYEYDASGLRTRRHSSVGNMLTYAYDEGGRLESISTDRGIVRLTKDAAGRVTERETPGQVRETRNYDDSGRLVRQEVWTPNKSVALRTYSYDREYNLLTLDDSRRAKQQVLYDNSERLDLVRSGERAWRFEFDPTGNLVNDSERYFEYGSGNRLVRVGDTTFGFDQLGSLIEARTAETVVRYEYDAENQLRAVVGADGRRTEFVYDAMGRRVQKRSATEGVIRYRWDELTLLSEEGPGASFEYMIDSYSWEPLFRLAGRRFESFHNDHLGTPQELTDEDGDIVWAASYHPYGETRSIQIDRTVNPIRFKGQYSDPETGLYYNLYRYYAPELRRYLNQDPFGLHGGFNQYRYTTNPVNWTDPLGLFDEYDIAPYGNAGHARDGLDADELLQSAWLRHHGYGGRSSSLGRQNPAVALDPSFHKQVSAEQARQGLHDADTLVGQTAGQNIRANAQLRRDLLRQRFIAENMSPRAATKRANEIVDDLVEQANAYVRANRLVRTC
jgi:RHS repeat-associated protein